MLARAGERTVLYRIRQGSIPIDFDFTVTPVHSGQMLTGYLEVRASAWIIPGAPEQIRLLPRHQLRRGFWNTFYTLTIVPEVDVQIMPVLADRASSTSMFNLVIITAIVVIAVASLAMFMLVR